jgi:predicted Zn finger-like uncharacterized protein
MIIACPACATRYVVPDASIGAEGRTVRCAKCRHSWFQDAAPLDPPPVATPTPAPQFVAPEPVPAPPPAAEATGPEAEPAPPLREDRPSRPPEAPTFHAPDPPTASQFDAAPPFRRRRNPLKLWTWAAAIFALLAAGTIAAVSYFGLPDWVPVSRPTFAMSEPDLQLEFPADQQERRQLPNGTEYFGASGSVTNIGGETRRLPTILIVLRDARDRIVYSWEVEPPQRSIAPGETVTINEAVTDVPRSARFAEIGWKPE